MTQLDLILIHPTLRLRQASLHDAQIALPWYQDLENLRLSEGESVTQPYSIETVQSMYKFLMHTAYSKRVDSKRQADQVE